MNFFHILYVELKRLLLSKVTWLVVMCTICMPLLGYQFYTPVTIITSFSSKLANPVLAGGLGGAFCFAVYTLYEYDRIKKYQCEVLMDSIASPIILSCAKCISLLLLAVLSWLCCICFYLPITMIELGNAFVLREFLSAYTLMMLPSLWMGTLASAALYQLFKRVDLSFISFTALALFSMSKWCSDLYLMRWINPMVTVFSNDFNNEIFYRLAGYSRLLWLSLFLAAYIFSLICIRNHGKGLLGSIKINLNKFYLPLLSVCLICTSGYLVYAEPYIDKAALVKENHQITGDGMSYVFSNEEENEYPDITVWKQNVKLEINAEAGSVEGRAHYQLVNQTGEKQRITINAFTGYQISKVVANGQVINCEDLQIELESNRHPFIIELPEDKEIDLEIMYNGSPKFSNASRATMMGYEITSNYLFMNKLSILPELQLNYDPECTINGEFTMPANFEPVISGTLPTLLDEGESSKTWGVENVTGRIRIIAGEYVKLEIKASPFPVYFYYSKRHQGEFEDIDIEKVLADTILYCTEKFGPLPFDEAYPLNIIMISAHFMGGAANGNFSFMGETFFSKENLSDPNKGASAAEVIAHEIIHQWWGNHCYLADMENTDWSSEGMTVYTTYRMMKNKYGEAYVDEHYVQHWLSSLAAMEENYFLRNPEMQKLLPDKYLMNLEALIFEVSNYNKVPLQLLKAEKLLGEGKMDKILADLFVNGGTEMPPYVTWQDFLDACGLKETELILDKAFLESLGGKVRG